MRKLRCLCSKGGQADIPLETKGGATVCSLGNPGKRETGKQ